MEVKMFGYVLIHENHLSDLLKKRDIWNMLATNYYWFHETPIIRDLLKRFANGEINHFNVEVVRDELANKVIELNGAEIQSGLSRVKWAEGLIRQLPEDHDGRNSWLMNYGTQPNVELKPIEE